MFVETRAKNIGGLVAKTVPGDAHFVVELHVFF